MTPTTRSYARTRTTGSPIPSESSGDGPLLRTVGFGNDGFVEYRDLAGLDGEELDTLIARQVQVFVERGEPFEWKLHGHDRPADLPDRLRAAGLAPEDTETVEIGRVDAVAAEPSLPDGVVIREVREPGDFARIAQLEESIWHKDHSWVDDLAEERAADPEGLLLFIAEAGDLTVCAGWVRFPSGTEFVTFWGGATLPAWRGRGIYRALVAHRAKLAAERRYIEVDASGDSRPILERLGFVAVTTTTPYVWSPRLTDATGAASGTKRSTFEPSTRGRDSKAGTPKRASSLGMTRPNVSPVERFADAKARCSRRRQSFSSGQGDRFGYGTSTQLSRSCSPRPSRSPPSTRR